MYSNPIKSFSVYGLFGTSDVRIPFDEPIKILVGENGLGKTQVLNMFYYTLTRNFYKLYDFVFDVLEMEFSDGEKLSILKNDVAQLCYDRFGENNAIREAVDRIGIANFEQLKYDLINRKLGLDELAANPVYREVVSLSEINSIWEELQKISNEKIVSPKQPHMAINKRLMGWLSPTSTFGKIEHRLADQLGDLQIMYFPTFRRVEEDLRNLGYDEEDFRRNQEDERLIHFGMDDVKKRFERVEQRIDQLLKEGLAQFTKDILHVVIDDETHTAPPDGFIERIDREDVELMLARVGGKLPDNQKNAVRNIVANKQFRNPLSVYLLQRLVDIYEKQKEIDEAVKTFRDICNRYLQNKQVYYDESGIKIFIKSSLTDEEIALDKLSSGEKQIISIFSKIYLSMDEQAFMLLFDEPELSLSITWQEQLLPDVVQSGKCAFLLAVTHSPFIYANDLDRYAVGLSAYVHIHPKRVPL